MDLTIERHYKCAKCGKEYTEDTVPSNDGCGGRIDVTHDLEAVKEVINRSSLTKRKDGLWKYFELMTSKLRIQ